MKLILIPDTNAQFQNALLLGDVPARVKVLEQVGQLSLAYMTALNHGLDELADNIYQKMLRAQPLDENGEPGMQLNSDWKLTFTVPLNLPPRREGGKLLFPPTPVFRLEKGNWPVTRLTRGPLDDVLEDKEAPGATLKLGEDHDDDGEHGAAWGDEEGGLESDEDGAVEKKESEDEGLEEKGEGWGEDSLDELVEDEPVVKYGFIPSRNLFFQGDQLLPTLLQQLCPTLDLLALTSGLVHLT